MIVGDSRFFFEAWAISFGAYGTSFILQALAWCLLIGAMGKFTFGWKDLEIYASSNVVRRTPGAIWYLIERVERYGKKGMSAKTTLAASGIEWLLLVIASALVYFLVSLNKIGLPLHLTASISFLLLLAFAIVSSRRRKQYAIGEVKSNSDRTKMRQLASLAPELLTVLLIYGFCYALGGVIINQLVRSSGTANLFRISDAIQLWALTGGIAFISSAIIPLNLGLREFTLSALLLPIVPLEIAVTIAAEVRLIFILADAVFSLGLLFLARRILARQQIGKRGIENFGTR